MRAAKVSSVILVVLTALMLCCTAASLVAVQANVDFPNWTGIGVKKSQLEGRSYAKAPELSRATLADGSFQDGCENYLADHVPGRDQVLLANAALQRGSIRLASRAFGFSCYPTYFDSEYLYLSEKDAVNFVPETWDDEAERLTRQYAQGVAKVARENPEKRFIVYVVPGAQSPSASPAYGLMSHPMTPELSYGVMSEELADVENAWVLTSEYGDLDEFYRDFFRGDHHWNVLGALTAYENIGKVLGWGPLEYDALKDFGDYRFFGSTARSGLDEVLEPVFDIDYSFADITIELTNGKKQGGDNHKKFYDYKPKSGQKFAFHTYYYNTQPPSGVFKGGDGTRVGLLVSNSYGAAISRPLATRYAELYRTNDLHADAHDQHISADFENADIDDVIFVAQPLGYVNAAKQSPDYFN